MGRQGNQISFSILVIKFIILNQGRGKGWLFRLHADKALVWFHPNRKHAYWLWLGGFLPCVLVQKQKTSVFGLQYFSQCQTIKSSLFNTSKSSFQCHKYIQFFPPKNKQKMLYLLDPIVPIFQPLTNLCKFQLQVKDIFKSVLTNAYFAKGLIRVFTISIFLSLLDVVYICYICQTPHSMKKHLHEFQLVLMLFCLSL
eukprot:TRINITY_DN11944_c0_g1_i4.p3 TRINITY_DN11944_c0_g1~~TRINITY_DN11944_c0_g1_i4.p3  ORF type:complete len:198 (-),score=-14.71 TRINITY_DN11944_c0_g1_i4:312-905(-)